MNSKVQRLSQGAEKIQIPYKRFLMYSALGLFAGFAGYKIFKFLSRKDSYRDGPESFELDKKVREEEAIENKRQSLNSKNQDSLCIENILELSHMMSNHAFNAFFLKFSIATRALARDTKLPFADLDPAEVKRFFKKFYTQSQIDNLDSKVVNKILEAKYSSFSKRPDLKVLLSYQNFESIILELDMKIPEKVIQGQQPSPQEARFMTERGLIYSFTTNDFFEEMADFPISADLPGITQQLALSIFVDHFLELFKELLKLGKLFLREEMQSIALAEKAKAIEMTFVNAALMDKVSRIVVGFIKIAPNRKELAQYHPLLIFFKVLLNVDVKKQKGRDASHGGRKKINLAIKKIFYQFCLMVSRIEVLIMDGNLSLEDLEQEEKEVDRVCALLINPHN